jgi:GntR family transcriptional repressor for pyruvate dehydrogenase complex
MTKWFGTPGTDRPSRAHENVVRTLLARILRGSLPPGAKLPTERALAAEFEVNRGTVREALRYLEHLELIVIRQGDGATVQPFLESGNLETAKAMVHADPDLRLEVLTAILEVRRVNSPEIAYAAALRRSPGHLLRLEETALRGGDLGILERDKAVHHIIALASGNILHILLTNFCQDFFDAFGHLYFENDANIRRSETFHRDILQALRDQDAVNAREIMRDVLVYAEGAVFKALGKDAAIGPGAP